MNKAIFIDRDGTLVPLHTDKPVTTLRQAGGIFAGVRHALMALRRSGYKLFLHTNQSWMARGGLTRAQCDNFHEEIQRFLGLRFDGICVAEEPRDVELDFDRHYRKPSPRFHREMAEKHDLHLPECWTVGDSVADAMAGHNAGTQIAFIGPRFPDELPVHVRNKATKFDSFVDFANWLLLDIPA